MKKEVFLGFPSDHARQADLFVDDRMQESSPTWFFGGQSTSEYIPMIEDNSTLDLSTYVV